MSSFAVYKRLKQLEEENTELKKQILSSFKENAELKQRLDPKCWKGKHKEGTKIKGGIS